MKRIVLSNVSLKNKFEIFNNNVCMYENTNIVIYYDNTEDIVIS